MTKTDRNCRPRKRKAYTKTQEAKLKHIIYTDRGMKTRVRKEEKLNPLEDKDPDWKHLEWSPKSQWRERERERWVPGWPEIQHREAWVKRGETRERKAHSLDLHVLMGQQTNRGLERYSGFLKDEFLVGIQRLQQSRAVLCQQGGLTEEKGHVRKRPCCLLTYNSRAESMGWNIRLKEITQVWRGASTQHFLTH